MDYTKLKKEELLDVIAELEPLAEKGKELVHLPKAVEDKDKEIESLKTKLNDIKTRKDNELESLENKLKTEKDVAMIELKRQHEEETKKLKDAIADSQKKLYDNEQMRIKQINELLYAHGDLLKLMQATVDTHMKLNDYIVKDLTGGNV